MARPAGILLDFYGTVVREDDRPIALISQEIARVSPLQPTPGQVSSHWGLLFDRLCSDSYGENFRLQREIELMSLGDVLRHFEAYLDGERLSQVLFEYWARSPAFPESRSVIARCGLPICLVSNTDNADLASALRHNGLAFELIVTSEDCRAYKPHPAPFERALSLLGLPPSHALHVGDSWGSDVVGAQAAGIPVLSINRRQRPIPDGGSPPTFMAADLTGLLEIVGPS